MGVLSTNTKTKLITYKDEFLTQFPNDEKDSNNNLIYTDSEWLDEVVKRWLKQQLKIGERKLNLINATEIDFVVE